MRKLRQEEDERLGFCSESTSIEGKEETTLRDEDKKLSHRFMSCIDLHLYFLFILPCWQVFSSSGSVPLFFLVLPSYLFVADDGWVISRLESEIELEKKKEGEWRQNSLSEKLSHLMTRKLCRICTTDMYLFLWRRPLQSLQTCFLKEKKKLYKFFSHFLRLHCFHFLYVTSLRNWRIEILICASSLTHFIWRFKLFCFLYLSARFRWCSVRRTKSYCPVTQYFDNVPRKNVRVKIHLNSLSRALDIAYLECIYTWTCICSEMLPLETLLSFMREYFSSRT